MKMKSLAFLAALSLGSFALAADAPDAIHGDYVEARTASVFAGPCHYNSELMTTGRDAIMAWNVTGGSWKGTDLTGVRAMAAVSSDDNLGNDQATRHAELLIDSSATDAQVAAFTEAVKAKSGSALGEIVQVRRGTISFKHDGEAYHVKADKFASCDVQSMPNHECCKQPNLVWYSPLATVTDRKVGFTTKASYDSGKISDRWEREEENSAFYGSFTL